MESSGSPPKDHTGGPRNMESWRRWSRMIGENLVKGATTALGTGSVTLFIWWIQSR
jgi:hypothetical protein